MGHLSVLLILGFVIHVWFSIDDGSRAAACGLREGDQIVDVNGYSFVDILHAEAVAILKSYQTLILTIKVSYIMYRLLNILKS